jgi:mRNA-degrading endonuclease toxin of MazEF toxin-antitoxin module
VRLDRRLTRLPRDSVANAYDLQKVLVGDFTEHLATLPPAALAGLDAELGLVVDL